MHIVIRNSFLVLEDYSTSNRLGPIIPTYARARSYCFTPLSHNVLDDKWRKITLGGERRRRNQKGHSDWLERFREVKCCR